MPLKSTRIRVFGALGAAAALTLTPAAGFAQTIAAEANEITEQAQEVAQEANAIANTAANDMTADTMATTTTTDNVVTEDPMMTTGAYDNTQEVNYETREEDDGFPWGLLGLLGLAGLLGLKGRGHDERDIHVDARHNRT